MLYEIPPDVYEQFPEHYHGVNLAIWLIFVVELVILFVISFLKAKKHESVLAKRLEQSFGLFALFYGISRVFFIFAIAIFPEDYDFYCSLAYFAGNLGFTFLIFALEQILQMKKHIFTIFGVISSVIAVLGIIGFNRTTVLTIIMVLLSIMTLLVAFLYIRIIQTSPGDLRKLAIIALMGLILFGAGIVIDGQFVLSNPLVPKFIKEFLSPILTIIGLGMVFYSRKTI